MNADPPSQSVKKVGEQPDHERLGSWKEIANYLNRTVRTVQRWEKKQGLPVRRLQHDTGSSVYAFKHELDRWLTRHSLVVHDNSRSARQPQPASDKESNSDEAIIQPVSHGGRKLPGKLIIFALIIVLTVAVSTAVLTRHLVVNEEEPIVSEIPRVLTTLPGVERFPALSPDGRQVVYSWDGGDNQVDLYLRLVGVDEHIRLTDDAAIEESPTWSPDGLSIAFLRRSGAGQRELRVIPALGGGERLVSQFRVPDNLDKARGISASADWSPDGRWIAVTQDLEGLEATGIVAIDSRTGEQVVLTRPEQGLDLSPSFSPDGSYIAFTRSPKARNASIHVMEVDLDALSPGRSWKLPQATRFNSEPEWTIDSRELIFSSGGWPRTDLWRVPFDGSADPKPLMGAGQGGSQASIAPLLHPGSEPNAWQLVYTVTALENDIWRIELAKNGNEKRLISTSQRERYPAYAPDGRAGFLSDRSGHREIWVVDAEGKEWQQWTKWESTYIWRPAFSPNGEQLAYAVETEHTLKAHIQDGPLAPARALTADAATDVDLAWSQDGNRIYLASPNRGNQGPAIWAVPPGGGELSLVAKGPFLPLGEDATGRWLLMSRSGPNNSHLERLDLQTGRIETIELAGSDRHSFTIGPDGVYFVVKTADQHEIRRWDWNTGLDVKVRQLAHVPERGMAISPDGRHALLARINLRHSDLMIINGVD